MTTEKQDRAEVVIELVELSLRLANMALEIKRQEQLTDELLLDVAEKKSASARERAEAFLAKHAEPLPPAEVDGTPV